MKTYGDANESKKWTREQQLELKLYFDWGCEDERLKKFLAPTDDKEHDDDTDFEIYEIMENIYKKIRDAGSSLHVESGYDSYYEVVGCPPQSMGIDQTLREFQDSIKAELDKIGLEYDEKEFGWHKDCYYDA